MCRCCMELIVSIYVWKTELDRRNLRSEMEGIQKKGKQHDNIDVTFLITDENWQAGSDLSGSVCS